MNHGQHDRLDEDERVSDEQWLTFLRHHPSLLILSQRIRREQ